MGKESLNFGYLYLMVESQNYKPSTNFKSNFILDSEGTPMALKLSNVSEGEVSQQCKTWNIHFDIFAWKNFQISKLFMPWASIGLGHIGPH